LADGRGDLASALDPDGRPVELNAKRWAHIVDGHPELGPHLESVMRAIRSPDRKLSGRRQGKEWLYLRGAGPSRWLKVVVHFEGGRGRIVTAFARRSMP
jgi:hypothetical protein